MFSKGPVVLFKWKNTEGYPVEKVSENVSTLIGYTSDEIKDAHLKYSSLISPEDVDHVEAEVFQNTEGNLDDFTHQPYRLIAKNGETIWVNDHTHIIRDESGTATHYVGYIYDITSKIESQNEREVAQIKLKSTLSSIDELIFVIDQNGYYTEFYSNTTDENLLLAPKNFLGKHYEQVMPEDNAKLIKENLSVVSKTGIPVSFEYQLAIDGRPKHFRCKITKNPDFTDSLSKYTFVVSDISEQKQAEERVQEYYELFSKSNDLLSISTFDGKVEAINPLWVSRFGFTQEYINQKGYLNLVHPEDKGHVYNELNRIRTDRPEVVKFECRVKTKKGAFIWTEWVATIDYKSKKVYSVTRDTSDAKREKDKAEKVSQGLFNLAKSSLLLDRSLEDFLHVVAREACVLLELDRFTYWKTCGQSLESVVSYDCVAEDFINLPSINFRDYPKYFKAISQYRIISSSQPRGDQEFSELTKDYFDIHNIKSTMDASLIGEEGLLGVLCAETITDERTWTSADKRDLSSIAEIIRTALFVDQKNSSDNELKKSRELMYALADNMPGLVYIKQPGGRHVYGNNRTLQYFGLSQEEYQQTTSHDILGKELADRLAADDLDCIKTNQTIYRQPQDPDGKEVYYDEYKFPITITGEEPLVGGIVIDMTERRKAQNELIESEAKYKMLVELANAVHWKLDVEKGEFTYMDEKIFDLTGFPASEFKTMEQWASKIPVLERETIVNTCNALSTKGEDHELIYRNVKPNGEIVWIKDSVSVVLKDGKPSSLVGYMVDITAQKDAETKLRDSEARFRSLVNDIQVGILLQGPNAEMLLCNPKALELLDLTEDQLLGKTSFDPDWNVIHLDGTDFPGETHPVPQAIATKKPVFDVTMGVYRPNKNDRIWLQVDANPRVSENGEVLEVICTFVDVSKRIIAEKERNESLINLQLAEQIAEIGYWSYNPATDDQVWSDQVYRIFEVDKETYKPVYGKQSYRMSPEDTRRLDEARYQAIHKGQNYDITLKFTFTPDRFKWIKIICQTSRIEGSNKYFSRGTVQDITQQKQAQEELAGFSRLQTLLMDLSSDYINMPSEKVNDSVNETLERLGEFVGVDRAYIFEYSIDYKSSVCTNNWVREGVGGIAINQPFEMTDLEEYIDAHLNGAYYQIEDIETQQNPKIRANYKSLGIRSMFTAPMMVQDKCIGFVGFDAVQTTKSFTPRETDLLKLFAELLVNLRQKVRFETSLVQKQNDLEKALLEKNTLFRELHHRIKNNLQLVSSLLYIKLDTVTEPALSGFITETIARILSISKIHDQLLKIEEIQELDIKTYLEELVENIVSTYCQNPSLYPLKISIKKAKFHTDDALLLGLLINESVSNIIKYAYEPEVGGRITIKLDLSPENEVTLIVADEGKGLPFTSLDEASQSNGIQLIRVFAQQLKGSLSLDSTLGTKYHIRFVKSR